MSSPPRGREHLWATIGPKPRPAAWPLPRLFRGGQARDGAEARVPVATAPPRGGPRPSWYVRVRGGPTRGEPSHPTGSTGAAPPYTCGAQLGCVPAAAPTWLTHRITGSGSCPNGCSAAAFGNTCWARDSRPLRRKARSWHRRSLDANAPALSGPTRAGSEGLVTDASNTVLY